ncbi:ferredoxin reductase domain-containing protein [Niabella drilacis]|uniref:Ferredoxin-NADP reductase n=1 Tax=Niabella drilacis (strain DSM 25811 / CCM 8410 / CCUG 62505 / LMG 26954 / E90) TaxID=1285928 RepID=A0A1G6J1R4_NIADE|nr:flavodoxin reductase [Niabella drilacis]SDC12533.1 Ferredoxin-NADP reductase [Niabella drilacis]
MKYPVKIRSIVHVTHDVLGIRVDKPEGWAYTPGQATEVFIDKEGWKEEGRPFTFTSLPDDAYLEFTIKTYPERKGVTAQLRQLKEGDTLLLNDIFGEIAYKGEGLFIAGGAGITPFIAILRQLSQEGRLGNNRLLFANKRREDIIHEEELRRLLGARFVNILSGEMVPGYEQGYISETVLKALISDRGDYVYLCGPPPMMDAVEQVLTDLQIDPARVVKEGF